MASVPATGIATDQRRRLLDAIVQVVAEQGYAKATVADVVKTAKVSRGTFYELFPGGKDECFVAAYARGVEMLHARIDDAIADTPRRRRAQLQAGIGAWLTAISEDPVFARVFLFELRAAGPLAQRARDASLRGFAERYGQSAGRARRPTDEVLFLLAAGIEELVAAHAREHGLDDLHLFLPTLTDTALSVLGGT